ncbi:MAG: 3-oxoacyl-ACP reductase FabG [bacterium]|nr:3-oxoacyl-ACP reductase FabG [bacterium]
MKNESRIAIVTGGARGIGRAIALEFALKGIIPVIYDIDSDAAGKVVAEIESSGGDAGSYTVDISNVSQSANAVDETVEKFGHIDILVNNGGVISKESIFDISEDEWNRVMDINVKSAVFLAQHVLKYMIPQKQGSIINISSLAGRNGGISIGCAYSVSKAALFGLTKRIARQVAEYGITVNAIAPGTTETEMAKKFTEDELRNLINVIPIGRLIKPKEIAASVVFLASEEARSITGAVIDVNGGMYMA